MLKNIPPILSPELLKVLCEMGHRPHAWNSFGTQDQQAADYAACKQYGPLYR